MDLKKYFKADMVNLGDCVDVKFDGIYAPLVEYDKKKIGVTEQFTINAEKYHNAFTEYDYYKSLLIASLSKIKLPDGKLEVLDIGSGSGNTVIPILDLLKDSNVVAADISAELLFILAAYLKNKIDYKDRVVEVCYDACINYYREGAFDLVVGAAILHHLIDPSLALSALSYALKPGGHAIFYEPFESGHAILKIAYNQILAHNNILAQKSGAGSNKLFRLLFSKKDLPSEHAGLKCANFLEALIKDFDVRSGTDKSNDIYKRIDDKWLFTKKYLEDNATVYGLEVLDLYPIHGAENPFSEKTKTYLRLGIGAKDDALPIWAWDILKYYDRAFSKEQSLENIIEGCILLRKKP